MDTITQITLGAAVGEAVLGRKMGNRAVLWGAVMGVVPDLDVMATPFVNEVEALAIHRGISHSILFCIAAAPFFGWLLDRWYKEREVGWHQWAWMVFWALSTHVMIDLCTSYGTQILQPFSDRLFSLHSIFIIDPLYTLPLMAGLITALFMKRNTVNRRWANALGIGVSTAYLLAGMAIKVHVNDVFEMNYQTRGIVPQQQMTTPAPLNTFLWNGYAVAGDTVYAGIYSIFDDNREIRFHKVPRSSDLLKPYRGDPAVERLLWFAQGYYSAEKENGELKLHNLRFGRSDGWLSGEPAPFVWNYQLQFNDDSTRIAGFQQYEPDFDGSRAAFSRLWDRIWGEE